MSIQLIIYNCRGDFFLHKNTNKILSYIKNENKITSCTIATNCIITPKQENIEILKDSKFLVRLSYYGTANENTKDRILDILKANNINYIIYAFVNQDGFWADYGDIDMPKHKIEVAKEVYKKCGFKVCTTLENGIISRCSRSTIAHKVQNFKPKRADLINVRSSLFFIGRLKKFIENSFKDKGIVEACFYCNGTAGQKIPAGVQLTKEQYLKIKNTRNN